MSNAKEIGGTIGQGIGQGIGQEFGGPAGEQVLGQAGKEIGEAAGAAADDLYVGAPPDQPEKGPNYPPDPGVADVSDSAPEETSTRADGGVSSGPDQNFTPG